jgi:hypothetical protein
VEVIDTDYPAAHSMDTTWFAVDKDGHVGAFATGENGSVPEGSHVRDGEAHLALLDWHIPPGSVRTPPRRQRIDVGNELALLGAFYFYYEVYGEEAAAIPCYSRYGVNCRNFAGPYIRDQLPPGDLLYVDQLPPNLRKTFSQIRFTEVSFAELEYVQPFEHLRFSGWGGPGRPTCPPTAGRCGRVPGGWMTSRSSAASFWRRTRVGRSGSSSTGRPIRRPADTAFHGARECAFLADILAPSGRSRIPRTGRCWRPPPTS